MAITVVNANRGTATEKVSDTTLTLAPNAGLSAGNYAILCVVEDNSGTTGGQTTTLSVTDDSGNGHTWTRDQERTNTGGGSALAGCTTAIFHAQLLGDGLATTDTITITNTANATAKGAGLFEVSVAGGNTLIVSGATGVATGGTSYTQTLGSLSNIEHLWVGCAGAEEELGTAVTLDTAYTAVFGGTIGSGTGGANATNVIASAGYLIETSTTQTFDNSGLTTADRSSCLVAYEEQAAAATTSSVHRHTTMTNLIRR